jgi:hypothetical protein
MPEEANSMTIDLDKMRKLSDMAERLYGNKSAARKAALNIMAGGDNPPTPEEEREAFIQDEMFDTGCTRWEAMALWNLYDDES